MANRGDFWKLGHLSDRELIESLGGVLQTQQRTLAELVAHLGEIEERRLHLEAAHPSLFDYCVSRLHMSEDEACRRIELARLSRRFPALFPRIASGELTLSVALLLKPVLTQANHMELIVAVRGKTIRRAREILAALFPSPDVRSTVRKLPERRQAVHAPPALNSTGSGADAPPSGTMPTSEGQVAPQPTLPAPASQPMPEQLPPIAACDLPLRAAETTTQSDGHRMAFTPPKTRSRIEPIAAERYKVQFTAEASIKGKIELARDLLRHTYPDGDLGSIVSRALDLLITDLKRTRFGIGVRPKVHRQRPAPATPAAHEPSASNCKSPAPSAEAPKASHTPVSRATRRAVLERDGLACTWIDESGKRCGSTAWLELDHRHPRSKGGSAEADNIRILCRAHNQLAAEREYGREHMARATKARQMERGQPRSSPIQANSPDGGA